MPSADLASSFNSFFNAATAFFQHLSDIHWTPFAIALGFLLAMQLCARLGLAQRAARRLSRRPHLLPAARAPPTWPGPGSTRSSRPTPATSPRSSWSSARSPHSSYPAVTSSFLVQTVFDTTVGMLVLLYAISQGLLPQPAAAARPARLRDLLLGRPPADAADRRPGRCCWRSRSAIYYLAHHVRRFWARVKQGLVDPRPAAPLPARGRRLAGARLALPLRRLLVLPRGVRDRRLGRQRDAGDERAGDRQRSSPSRRAAPAPSRRCWWRP